MLGGDPDTGDAGACHAPRAAGIADRVAPRAVGIGGRYPVLLRPDPHLLLDAHPDTIGFVEGEKRELGVGIVARPLGPAVRPRAGCLPLRDLRSLEPLDVPLEDRPIVLGREHRQEHRLERHRVGLLRLLATDPLEPALHLGVIGGDARIGQRQHHQRRGADTGVVGPHRHLPGAVGLLFPEEPVAGFLDRPLNLLRGNLRPLAVGGEADAARCERAAEDDGTDQHGKEETAGRHRETPGR